MLAYGQSPGIGKFKLRDWVRKEFRGAWVEFGSGEDNTITVKITCLSYLLCLTFYVYCEMKSCNQTVLSIAELGFTHRRRKAL